MGILGKLFSSGKTLLFADAFERTHTPWIIENYRSVLSDLGIRFWYRPELKMPSGYELLMAGAHKEFEQLIEENKQALDELGVSQVIVCSDEAYYVFSKHYPDIKVVHALDLVHEQKDKLLASHESDAVYYDVQHLKELNFKRVPREVLFALGCKVREYPSRGGRQFATGAEALLNIHSPRCASRIASEMLRRVEGQTVVVASPRVYDHLKKHADMHDVDLREISEFMVEI